MTTTTRLLAFALVLVLALGAGWALGAAVGPVDAGPSGPSSTTTTMAAHTGAHP